MVAALSTRWNLLFRPTFPFSPARRFRVRRRFGLHSSSGFLAPPSMAMLLLPSLWLLQQGRSNGFVLETDALFLRGPPLQKLCLCLQLGLLRLYVPQRAALLLRHVMWLALQLLDLGEGYLRAGGRV